MSQNQSPLNHLAALALSGALAACGGGDTSEPDQPLAAGSAREQALAYAKPTGVIPTDAHTKGMFSAVAQWPLIPIHAALLPDGRVLTFGTDPKGKQGALYDYDVWDPSAGLGAASHLTLANGTGTDTFCSTFVSLPWGSGVIIYGGDVQKNGKTTNTGNQDTTYFNPTNESLNRNIAMQRKRWYATATTLLNGDQYIQGGTGGGDFPERRTYQRPSFTASQVLLSGVSTADLSAIYPRNFVAPDGRIFGYDGGGTMYYVNPQGKGDRVTLEGGLRPWKTYGSSSSAAMFRPGRILQFGGSSNAAVVIDITKGSPEVSATESMSSVRHLATATILANGQVLATGGSSRWNAMVDPDTQADIAAYTADTWNPDTGRWTIGATYKQARLYHSNALLLPDATVLVSGGGAPGPQLNTNAELYFPPYLFAAGGKLAARPIINSAPAIMQIGQNHDVTATSGKTISRAVLVRTGSVSHSFNNDQRFVELGLTVGAGGKLKVQGPAKAADAPPGMYMLFLLDNAGVPSVAKMVRVPVMTDGKGLRGQYFNSHSMRGDAVVERVEAVDFDWGNAAPAMGFNTDIFSARWTGFITAPRGGNYKFKTYSDDGVRLWIDGELVIDDWSIHAPRQRTSRSFHLAPGQRVSVKLDYYEQYGGAVAQLLWTTPENTRAAVIPPSQLTPSD